MEGLTKEEIALLIAVLQPVQDSDYWQSMEDMPKIMKMNGVKNSNKAEELTQSVWVKLNEEYYKNK